MIEINKLIISAIISLVVVVLLKLFERKFPKFIEKRKKPFQIVCGILLGLCAAYATEFGSVSFNGAGMNVRDIAPISAGVFFGPLAGFISGLIGGIDRFLCVYWGGGVYTRYACSISTFCAGLLGGFLYKYMFKKKRPRILQAAYAAITIEVFHMLMVFFTNLDDLAQAYVVVKACTGPMIFGNAIAISIITIFVKLIENHNLTDKEKEILEFKKRLKAKSGLSIIFQKALLILISLAFLGTTLFNRYFGSEIGKSVFVKTANVYLQDVCDDIDYLHEVNPNISREKFNDIISNDLENWRIGESGGFIIFDENLICIDSNDEYKGLEMSELQLVPDGYKSSSLYEINIFDKECYAMYMIHDDYLVIAYNTLDEIFYYANVFNLAIELQEVFIYAFLFVLIYFMLKKCVIDPSNNINSGLNSISKGNLDTKIKELSSKEFEYLSNEINNTVSALKRFKKESEDRMEKDLALAKLIQTSSCPKNFDAFAGRNDIDIYASMDTAKEVGGDFYDFYFVSNNKIILLIADVSGKGIPAAMFMMKGKSIIKSYAERGLSTSEVMEKANVELCEGNDAEMFITAWLGCVDLDKHTLSFTSAGHNPPLIKRKDSNYEYLKSKSGLVLAAMDMAKYQENVIPFEPGDMIYLYTDGVTEANNKNDELYSEERLQDKLNLIKRFDCKHICEFIKLDVDKFANGREQFDDITMLSFALCDEYYKKDLDSYTTEDAITVVATVDNQRKITEFIETNFADTDIDEKTLKDINVCIDEIYSNIANYAYGTSAGLATVYVKVLQDPLRVSITFLDGGVPYNPLDKEDPNTKLSADEREIGGLGIFMVKKLMDNLKYEYVNGMNKFTIEKNIVR